MFSDVINRMAMGKRKPKHGDALLFLSAQEIPRAARAIIRSGGKVNQIRWSGTRSTKPFLEHSVQTASQTGDGPSGAWLPGFTSRMLTLARLL